MARQRIFSTIINNEKLYVKSYRKANAVRFLNKIDRDVTVEKKDVYIETIIDPSIKVINELYPELIKPKQEDPKDNKYFNMFNNNDVLYL
ncbi:MAG: hypothetical protein PF484_10155 [Bacteroidales bacterium]|jgi:hypothetical protein|nr:hypothetical protein [Bacteroidales bacterium]